MHVYLNTNNIRVQKFVPPYNKMMLFFFSSNISSTYIRAKAESTAIMYSVVQNETLIFFHHWNTRPLWIKSWNLRLK